MMENVIIYGLIIFTMYLILGARKYVGEATKEIHTNHSRYKMEQMFGKDSK